jgi:site-specific DNA-cytosine methylase
MQLTFLSEEPPASRSRSQGFRAGLADPRGNLMLTYLAIAAKYRPRWLVWENVPGVLSSNKDGTLEPSSGAGAELGYGFAYRVLDAQFCRAHGFARAVPQRRRRVFVVGYLGDWRRAAAVLFDGASLRGDSAPRREAGQDVAPTISSAPYRRWRTRDRLRPRWRHDRPFPARGRFRRQRGRHGARNAAK